MSDETISADKLEELFALPSPDGDTEPEWITQCDVQKNIDLKKDRGTPCPKPAVVNITLICPFCGPHTFGLCEEDMSQGTKGELWCVGCSKKAKVQICMKPVSCVWKSD